MDITELYICILSVCMGAFILGALRFCWVRPLRQSREHGHLASGHLHSPTTNECKSLCSIVFEELAFYFCFVVLATWRCMKLCFGCISELTVPVICVFQVITQAWRSQILRWRSCLKTLLNRENKITLLGIK